MVGRVFHGKVRRIHFVGAGGVGMSGIAEVLLDEGFEVSGSDIREGEAMRRLRAKGARMVANHAAEHVHGSDVVVYSSAVGLDNPELAEARLQKIPVIPRAEMLGELMRLKVGVAIAGSHGKTTTTSLVATVLRGAALDPTVVIGGRLNALGSGALRGQGSLLVAEADESDGSFLHLSPTIAVVTNIDPEHLDHYGTEEALLDAFVAFVNRVPFFGLVIACLDHPNVQAILPRIEKRVATYGLAAHADYRVLHVRFEGMRSSFEVIRRGESLGTFCVHMPGMHNVMNALATLAVADELGVSHENVRDALSGFEGVSRRFSLLGEWGGVAVVDDYGHHPAEIEATLKAAQQCFDRRLVVVFQPHRYSRTAQLFEALSRAFNLADVLVVTDIYGAGEAPIEGVSASRLVDAIRDHGHKDVVWVPDLDAAESEALARVKPGDVLVTMGAGSITQLAETMQTRLAALSRSAP